MTFPLHALAAVTSAADISGVAVLLTVVAAMPSATASPAEPVAEQLQSAAAYEPLLPLMQLHGPLLQF
jgi:hypothetical protein